MAYHPVAVANVVIELANQEFYKQYGMLRLNKIIYLIAGHMAAETGSELLTEPILAWEHGPVIKSVYKAFKPQMGSRNLSDETRFLDPVRFGPEARVILINEALLRENHRDMEIIRKVITKYSHLADWPLAHLTHLNNGPWSLVYAPGKNNPISFESLRDYFQGKLDI